MLFGRAFLPTENYVIDIGGHGVEVEGITVTMPVGAPRGPLHGGVADLFNTDVRSILMVLLAFQRF